MGAFIMENGWSDPTGTVPAIWFGQPDEPPSINSVDDTDRPQRAA